MNIINFFRFRTINVTRCACSVVGSPSRETLDKLVYHADGVVGDRLKTGTRHAKRVASKPAMSIAWRGPYIFAALVGLLWFGALVLRADDRYVVAPGTIADGGGGVYTDWTIAATQIQWAVDTAVAAGDTVWVSNGVYVLTNQIVVTNAIILRSTNGPNVTVINGGFTGIGMVGETTNKRCLLMSNAAAFVHGFTISNGAVCAALESGGGVRMYSGILSNCVVCNNTVFAPVAGNFVGGGIYMADGAGTVTACRVTGNLVTNSPGTVSGFGYGGGIYLWANYLISDCIISNNIVAVDSSQCVGGGIYGGWLGSRISSSLICNNRAVNGASGGVNIKYYTVMEGCTVTVNRASSVGGCDISYGVTVSNCVISYNKSDSASFYAGGIEIEANADWDCWVYNTTIIGNTNYGVRMISTGRNQLLNCVIRDNRNGVYCYNGTLRNCLITGNTNAGGLFIHSSCQTALVSCCTITSNQSTSAGSGIRIEATNANVLISSCVIYSNGVSGTDDVFDACAPTNIGALQYSCIGTNPGGYFTGAGIKVADPQFKNFAGGNYRLKTYSPCINTGTNQDWMTNAVDLDGGIRIRYEIVDMGAYEYELPPAGSIIRVY